MAIVTKNIFKNFGKPPTEVLKGISIEIRDGEFVSITGKSGSGKSTLLYILSTLDTPTSGELLIDNQNIHKMSEKEIHDFRNRSMGFVFQFHYLLNELNVLENVLMPATKNRQEKEKKEYALHLLEEFGLSHRLNYFPGQISGGERQRVAIARALVMNPKYLLADEPTGNLDSENSMRVIEIFKKMNKTKNMSIIMITHDPDYAKRADRQIHISDGKIEN